MATLIIVLVILLYQIGISGIWLNETQINQLLLIIVLVTLLYQIGIRGIWLNETQIYQLI